MQCLRLDIEAKTRLSKTKTKTKQFVSARNAMSTSRQWEAKMKFFYLQKLEQSITKIHQLHLLQNFLLLKKKMNLFHFNSTSFFFSLCMSSSSPSFYSLDSFSDEYVVHDYIQPKSVSFISSTSWSAITEKKKKKRITPMSIHHLCLSVYTTISSFICSLEKNLFLVMFSSFDLLLSMEELLNFSLCLGLWAPLMVLLCESRLRRWKSASTANISVNFSER